MSGAVLAVVVLGAAWLGGVAFAVVVLAVGVLGLHEWLRLVGLPPGDPVVPLSFAALVAVFAADVALGAGPGLAILVAASLLILVLRRAGLPDRILAALGLPYMGLAVTAMLWLRNETAGGPLLTFWLFAVVWATDIGGYAVGRTFGGPRLAPRISPGKTWSGFAGGTAAAVAAGGLAAALAGRPAALAGLVAAGLSVASQIGDLCESALKRRAGVKDSGDLIPGHGGLLDRIDGLIFAAPLLALFAAAADPLGNG